MGSIHPLSPCPESPQSSLAGADGAAARTAARQVASGVSVVTMTARGERYGLTASSVCLISSEPMTLLVAVGRASAGYSALVRARRFAVNVLSGDQREVAEQFDGFIGAAAEPLEAGRWLPLGDGLYGVADCAAVFECAIEETFERGGNAFVIGRIQHGQIGGGSGALIRWRGAYESIGWSPDEISRAVGLMP